MQKHRSQMKDLKNQKGKNSLLNSYARLSGIAFQMFGIIASGTFAGIKLDDYLKNKNNLFTIILSLLAVLLSIVYVVRSIISCSKDNE